MAGPMNEPTNADRITVAVVDNHEVDRHGLVAAVKADPGLVLRCAVGSVPDLTREMVLNGSPDVVLLDLALGGGLEGIEAIYLSQTGLAIVVVSSHFREATILDGYAAGARAVLPKSSGFADISQAIRTAAAGGTHHSPQAAAAFLNGYDFTAQERRVLELVAQGMTDQEIADELHTTKDAITGQLDRIGTRSGARKRSGLTELFFRHFREPQDDAPPDLKPPRRKRRRS